MAIRINGKWLLQLAMTPFICLFVCAAGSPPAHAISLEITLAASQFPGGNGQSAGWFGPTTNISSEVGLQADAIAIDITFANNQYLRMIDYSSFQVDRIGLSLGGFSVADNNSASLTQFWVSYQVAFTDKNGDPILAPPLTNNPVSSSYRIDVPASGYVFGAGNNSPANFLSPDNYAEIYGLHYTIGFFGDSSLTTPQTVYFASGSAQFRPSLFAADPISTGESSTVPEPSTMLLLGSGLLGVVGIARRRKS